MIPKINKILYATDLSKNSAYAFRYAVNSAEKHDAKIHILNVLEKLSPTAESMVSGYISQEKLEAIRKENIEGLKDRIQKRLAEFCKRELLNKPECQELVASIQVVEGDPAEEILQKADDLKADVVIMGTHGKGLLAHTFLGSVAEKVLHRIKIPVFIIPIPKETDISFRDI
ncbi:MAG: universal stress protein [Deltaproteobacteria bacterium]|nr:universal stress protein [Deltaproteobacteria bacterium]